MPGNYCEPGTKAYRYKVDRVCERNFPLGKEANDNGRESKAPKVQDPTIMFIF
ncbi:hypothetical protein [Sphingomonas aerolata]|uniref:hypothetical protein n=1 Tax=Sphingomonas aerolata TaxID=185951 RepID=UPI002FE28666